MLFLWLMTFSGLLGQCFCIKKVGPTAFKKLAKRLQDTCLNNIGVIRSDHGGEFQNKKNSAPFVKSWAFFTTSLLQGHLNKMVWWKERTNHLKNWP